MGLGGPVGGGGGGRKGYLIWHIMPFDAYKLNLNIDSGNNKLVEYSIVLPVNAVVTVLSMSIN
jgi:hypothetical protein